MKRWKKVALFATLVTWALYVAAGIVWAASRNREPIDPFTLRAGALVLAGLTLAAFAPLTLMAIQRRRRRSTLDEGGMRVTLGTGKRYVPFAAMKEVRVAEGDYGAALELETHEGERLVVAAPEGPDALDTVLRRAGEDSAGRHAATPHVRRARRGLGAWTAELDHLVGAGGYRNPALEREGLRRLAGDLAAAPEARAAASYLLCRSGETCALDDTTPPIVVVMAALAAPGTIDERLVARALRLLDPEDHAAAIAGRQRTLRIAIDATAPDGTAAARDDDAAPAEAERAEAERAEAERAEAEERDAAVKARARR